MRRPRFLPSRLPKDYVDPSATSHPAGESLLQQIDADLDTIEVTLLQLESESQQYSHRLSLIRDVLHMFDTSEHPNAASALREREQTVARSTLEAARDIDAALSENERRRASLLETA